MYKVFKCRLCKRPFTEVVNGDVRWAPLCKDCPHLKSAKAVDLSAQQVPGSPEATDKPFMVVDAGLPPQRWGRK